MTQPEHSTKDSEHNSSSEQGQFSQENKNFTEDNSSSDSESSKLVIESEPEVDSISRLKAELQQAKDQWLRSEAESQNLRNRHKKELEDTRLYAVHKFARDIVEAAENLRRGIDSLPKPSENEDPIITKMREGLESIERSFLQILEKNGIKSEDPTGIAFDANKHQAMAEHPSDEHPPGTVMQSWTPTWTLNNRLLKPAMVIVTKTPENKS
ncbi:Protein GrpE [Commensalibacter sp. Nvir]|uniref:nucleotide exchange factor GrpE n=1 Tax=Commensalibacter sp. Nvir TaxID=3069817 RepID=UPI002D344ADC|nr:Protein GrpE [Commensalibacter sp. Nvir]